MHKNSGSTSPSVSQKLTKENSIFRFSFKKKKNKTEKESGNTDLFPDPLVKRREPKSPNHGSAHDVADGMLYPAGNECSPSKKKPPLPPKTFSRNQLKIKMPTSDDEEETTSSDDDDSDKAPEINCGETTKSTSTSISYVKSNVTSGPVISNKLINSKDKQRKNSIPSCQPERRGTPVQVKYVRVHGMQDGAYKNDTEPRGLIFMKNVESFDNDRYAFRKGARQDYYNFLDLFQQMGYKKHTSFCESGRIPKDKLMRDLKSFSKLEHKIYDSTIIILMSHGVRDKTFLTSDNEEVDLMDVYSLFNNCNCEGLRNKPKIFILQFCRPASDLRPSLSQANLCSPTFSMNLEDVIDQRVKIQVDVLGRQLRQEFQRMMLSLKQPDPMRPDGQEDGLPNQTKQTDEKPSDSLHFKFNVTDDSEADAASCPSISRRSSTVFSNQDGAFLSVDGRAVSIMGTEPVPDYSDMYSIFATNSGGLAYRNIRKGSLLIQAICHVFSNHAFQDDIEELVRKVSKRMQQELSKDDPLSRHPPAVVERVNNGLDKAFYFNPYPVKERRRSTTLKW